MAEFSAGLVSEFALGSMKAFHWGGQHVLVFRHPDGAFSALEDRCSHAEVGLSGGTFQDGCVECPAHGARFDAVTGKQLCMPAVTPVRTFVVKEAGGQVLVVIPS